MEISALQDEVAQEVQKRAEELAKEKVRNLTLRRRQLKAVLDRTEKRIAEVDKEVNEIKVEDFEEEALRDVTFKSKMDRFGFSGALF